MNLLWEIEHFDWFPLASDSRETAFATNKLIQIISEIGIYKNIDILKQILNVIPKGSGHSGDSLKRTVNIRIRELEEVKDMK
jgi:hypothetical protein